MNTLEQPLFSIEHKGQRITGREVMRNRRQLVVQLVHPFGLLHTSLFMPGFMAAAGATLEGPLGDEKRDLLLRDLYEQASWIADLLPVLQRAMAADDGNTRVFTQDMEEALDRAHSGQPLITALPWKHPRRFHTEVSWLRANATLPPLRIALPPYSRELEWQVLLLLHHAMHGRFIRLEELGHWEGN
ncbi:MAG: hypothetical protein JNL52_09060 [Flavobacteriales bacterium]|nr:hypothetical protein [Flavobacteriales bacterium]